MEKLKSELTWSFSRSRLFSECRRAYFYYYYASWGGWDKDADEIPRKAYVLKNIRNIDAWIGDIVHQLIKWVLENKIAGKDILFQEAVNKAKQLLLQTWEQSRSKMWMKNIKCNLNLFEHYYGRELPRGELSVRLQKVITSIKNIYESELLASFSSLSKENFLIIDELDCFDFEGIKMFAIPDFAVYNKTYILYDWKTGQPSDKDVLQLSCYALYAMKKWKASFSQIKIIPVYLAVKDVFFEPIKADSVQAVENYIRGSIEEMKAVLVDVKENKIDIQNCPKTKDNWRCRNCKFQEICK